jgi:hypothetical protein
MRKIPKGKVRVELNIPIEDKAYLDKLREGPYSNFENRNELLNHVIDSFVKSKRQFFGNLK